MTEQVIQRFSFINLNNNSLKQISSLFFFFVLSWIILVFFTEEALWQTLLIDCVVASSGMFLINRLSQELEDVNIKILGYFFLIKLILVLFLLYTVWVPFLDPTSELFGFDPQRYYFDANELAQSKFSLDALPGINYAGILFYYGAIFAVFGHNPAIPAILNTFLTLLASLLIVKVGYQIKRERNSYDWTLGLFMVVPEVLWFDLMTSRETLMMSLIVFSLLYLILPYLKKPSDFPIRHMTVVIPVLVLIGAVRTSMLIPVFISLLWIIVLSKETYHQRLWSTIIFGSLAMLIIMLAPSVSEILGSNQVDYFNLFHFKSQIEDQLDTLEWSDRSVGRLFIADNVTEIIAFAPIRFIFYLIAPLPHISVNIIPTLEGNLADVANLMVMLSAMLYIVLFPLAISSAIQSLKNKKWKAFLVFHIPFWVIMVFIASGNQTIHERYRIMIIPFLWGCIWLGRTCSVRLLKRVYVGWVGFLSLGGLLFALYKY